MTPSENFQVYSFPTIGYTTCTCKVNRKVTCPRAFFWFFEISTIAHQRLVILYYLCLYLTDCGSPPSLTDGTVTYNMTVYNSSATYECDYGYNASKSDTEITCLSTGAWDSIGFTCDPKGTFSCALK